MRNGSRAPVIAIALDSMDVRLVRRGIQEGWLPTIASIAERGRSGTLSGLQALVPGASWPSTITSTSVGDHHLLLDRQLKPGSYELKRVSFRALRRPPFWAGLGELGLRTTVASLYSAPLITPFLGAQLIGWGAHDPYAMWRPHVHPPELLDRLNAEVGERRVADEGPFRTHADYRRNLVRTLNGAGQQGRGLRYLMAATEWDLFLGAFGEAHNAGHRIWHYHDPAHPDHDAAAPDDLKTGLLSIYRAIDEGLRLVLEQAPPEAFVVLFSPHGMDTNNLLGDPTPRLLEQAGWFVPRHRGGGTLRVRSYAAFRSIVQRTIPRPIRKAIGKHVPTDMLLTQISLRNMDPSRTRAFAIPSDGTSFIRLNVKGREPAGTVARGAEYDRLCEEISTELCGLLDAESGISAVIEVVRMDSLIAAPVHEVLPDLIVRWNLPSRLQRLRSPSLGTIEIPQIDARTGQHSAVGWIMAAGPGIESNPELLVDDLGLIQDVGPTILALLGAPRPEQIDGSPIEGIAP